MRYQSYSKRIEIVHSCVYSLIDAADADGDASFAWQLTPGNTLSDTDNGVLVPVPARSVQTIAISTVSIVKWIILVVTLSSSRIDNQRFENGMHYRLHVRGGDRISSYQQ